MCQYFLINTQLNWVKCDNDNWCVTPTYKIFQCKLWWFSAPIYGLFWDQFVLCSAWFRFRFKCIKIAYILWNWCVFCLDCNVAPAVSCLIWMWNEPWFNLSYEPPCIQDTIVLFLQPSLFKRCFSQTKIVLSNYGLSGIQDTTDTSFVEPWEWHEFRLIKHLCITNIVKLIWQFCP